MKGQVSIRVELLIVALSLTMPLLAQYDPMPVQFGFRGAAQVTHMEFNREMLDASNRSGFSVGPVVKFKTPVMGLGIDIAALYDQRYLKIDGQSFRQKSIIIPANARLGVSVFDVAGVFLSAGPQLSFNVGDDVLHWTDEASADTRQFVLQSTQLSINVGGGVNIGSHFEVAVYYNIPLGRTGDVTWSSLRQQLSDEDWKHAKTTVDAWRICLNYYF